jgi:hypothetical protein
MKLRTGAFILFFGIVFYSCHKDGVKPNIVENTLNQGANTSSSEFNHGAPKIDSSANSVTGYLRLRLYMDSINSDNVLISFKPNSSPLYVSGEDAPTLQGFGQVSLSSFSSDNIPLAINTLPLTLQGVKIALRVTAKSDGVYNLQMKSISGIPSMYSIWLMDSYKKDSLDLRQNPVYAFNIYNADTTSFGSNRFKLVIRTP